MLDAQFYNSFVFAEYHYCKYHVNDYTVGTGVRKHFFGKIKSGKGRFVNGDVSLQVNKGDVFYIPNGEKYRSYWYPEVDGKAEFYSLGFEYIPVEDGVEYKLQKIDCTAEEMMLLDEICRDVRVTPLNVGRIYTFFAMVSDRMAVKSITVRGGVLARAVEYMKAHTRYTVKDVADHCGVSESGLYAAFKKEYGKTPVEVKHDIVAKKAKELLARTDLSIEEICNRLNFNSTAYFRKIIKEQTGKTPSEIRKKGGERHR